MKGTQDSKTIFDNSSRFNSTDISYNCQKIFGVAYIDIIRVIVILCREPEDQDAIKKSLANQEQIQRVKRAKKDVTGLETENDVNKSQIARRSSAAGILSHS